MKNFYLTFMLFLIFQISIYPITKTIRFKLIYLNNNKIIGINKDITKNIDYSFKDSLNNKKDGDNDGVVDSLDLCPNTPENVEVNSSGCGIDTDEDGIPDYEDLCPYTLKGIKVDEYGCPYDIDADGVPDYKDKCPNTPAGNLVNENGCSLNIKSNKKKVEQKEPTNIPKKKEIKRAHILNKKINRLTLYGYQSFPTGKTILLPSVYPLLDGLIQIFKKDLFSKWRIEGYTDNIGSKDRNQKISLERAKAVLDYFISKGVVKKRFKIFGLGESFPIASNKTKKGRAKNRRIVIIKTY